MEIETVVADADGIGEWFGGSGEIFLFALCDADVALESGSPRLLIGAA